MKALVKLIAVFIAVLLASSNLAWGQDVDVQKNKYSVNGPSMPIPARQTKMVKLNKMYFIDKGELASCFKTGEVPNGFPGYNYALSEEENKRLVKKWLEEQANKALLTKQGKQKLENYTKEK